MYKFAFISLLFLFSANAMAAGEIAVCNTNLKGYSYYPKEAEFESDFLEGFNLTVRRIDKDKFDVLYVDRSKSVKSATQEGGSVVLLERGIKAFSILVNYPGHSSDIYTFTKGDKYTVALQTIRSGDRATFPKNALLTGVCQQINIPN